MPNVVVVGSINMDLTVLCDRLPEPGETLIGYSLSTVPGGKGGNQAVAASRLGGNVKILGCLGKDTFGKTLYESLAQEGVGVEQVLFSDSHSSGIAIIHVDKTGQNSITVIPGANETLEIKGSPSAPSSIETSDVLITQLEVPLEAVGEAVLIARYMDVPCVLDPAPVPEGGIPEDLFLVDVFTPNQSETEAITGIRVTDLRSAEIAGERLLDKGAKAVVIKAGKLGAFVVEVGEKVQHIKAFPVKVKDTVAAGDAFTAALALGVAEGVPLKEAVRTACAAGAIAVTRTGAQSSMPFKEDVEDLLSSDS